MAVWPSGYTNTRIWWRARKTALDRGVENVVGRRVYQVLDTIRSRRGAAAVAGNISSALTNIAPVVQVISEHPIATVKGMMGMMCELDARRRHARKQVLNPPVRKRPIGRGAAGPDRKDSEQAV